MRESDVDNDDDFVFEPHEWSGLQVVQGNIDPENIFWQGFDREKYPPPLSGGLQEGTRRYYSGDGLHEKLKNDPYRVLWSFENTTSFGYLVTEAGLTTFFDEKTLSGVKFDSLMQAWLLDFVVNPSEKAQRWIELRNS
jgi:hypothetical protein